MCANPKTAVAARSCCGIVVADRAELNYKFEYHGEIVTAETNEAQCIADGGYVCDPTTLKADNPIVDARPKYSELKKCFVLFVQPVVKKNAHNHSYFHDLPNSLILHQMQSFQVKIFSIGLMRHVLSK